MMQRSTSSFTILAIGLLLASFAVAQAPTGNLFGTIADEDGEPIAGATVTLSGLGADRDFLTDVSGQYRFLSLDPGVYHLRAELEGFSAVEFPAVVVRVGRNTGVPLVLQSAVAEVLTVSSESPLLDEREIVQGITVARTELETIPSTRDPWAFLTQTPGVLTDRVNVGGSESDGQSRFRAQGVDDRQNDFLLDGMQVTDLNRGGTSSTHFDFDQFAEMQFSTGGTDVTKNTAGVTVNLVTKRGSNEFRGSARFFETRADGYFGGLMEQAEVDVGPEDMGPGQEIEDYSGNQLRGVEDMGFEAGGALVRDRAWLWGSWGQSDVAQFVPTGQAERIIFENTALKANLQFTPANSFVASWSNGDKQWLGRDAGLDRPPETTWDQRGPSAHYRFEDTHVFSSNLFVTGMYSFSDLGWEVVAKGGRGPNAPESWRRSDGVWQDNYISTSFATEPAELKGDASYFFSWGKSKHEIRVGGRYRENPTLSGTYDWPGRQIFTYNTTSTHFVVAKRGAALPLQTDYFSLWAQDTIALGRLTINAGLRYDDQSGFNGPASVPAHPMVPNVLPALDYAGGDEDFSWEDLVPRVGITYAAGADRTTLIRASFAQFADQLNSWWLWRTNPVGEAYAYFAAPYEDGPYTGDGSEFDDPSQVAFAWGFDPANPDALENPNVNDPGLESELTSELVASVEHAILPELVLGLNLTWRNIDRIHETRAFIREPDGSLRTLVADDYVFDGTIEGMIPGGISGGPESSYEVPIYALRDDFEFTGGSLLLNGSRERDYLGANVTWTKRLSNQWMLRGYVNWGKAEWRIPADYIENSDPNFNWAGDDRDGGTFITGSNPYGRGVRLLQSTWTAHLSGMYQVAPTEPWGFNLSGSFQAREGYPLPYIDELLTSSSDLVRASVVDDVTDYRLDDLFIADLRVEKEFNLRGSVNLTFGIDAFNITNEGTEMSRESNLSISRAFWLYDNVAPRIYRLGVRLSWR